jgi:hypothetical protein
MPLRYSSISSWRGKGYTSITTSAFKPRRSTIGRAYPLFHITKTDQPTGTTPSTAAIRPSFLAREKTSSMTASSRFETRYRPLDSMTTPSFKGICIQSDSGSIIRPIRSSHNDENSNRVFRKISICVYMISSVVLTLTTSGPNSAELLGPCDSSIGGRSE